MRLKPLVLASTALGATVLAAVALAFSLGERAAPPASVEVRTLPQDAAAMQLSFAPLVRAASPSVVNIYATRVVAERSGPFAGDPFFRDLFGDLGPLQPRMQNALGSGVILGRGGLVVTNVHVVSGAQDIRAVLADRREYRAGIVLEDAESDIAVLRLQVAGDLPALDLADSDAAQVGDLVLAIGNPFGVGQSVSSGIVSALGRSTFDLRRGSFLQTDAAINPGNSGGALIDMQGRLLGINTAILTRGGGSNGIGFAVPANLVKRILEQAEAGATRFVRPWAGINGQAVDAIMAEALGLPGPDGVLVSELHPQSPFAMAGLRPGDVILSLDGHAVHSPQDLMFRLAVASPGSTAPFGYARGGATATAEVALAPPPQGDRDARTFAADIALRGLSVARIDPALIVDYGLPLNAAGTLVTGAQDRAARAGLRPGDILLAINGRPVATPAEVEAAAAERARLWQVEALRGGTRIVLRFRF